MPLRPLPSRSRFDPHPQRLMIFHLILGGGRRSSITKGVKVLEITMGAVFAPTRFSVVRVSIRHLVPNKSSFLTSKSCLGREGHCRASTTHERRILRLVSAFVSMICLVRKCFWSGSINLHPGVLAGGMG